MTTTSTKTVSRKDKEYVTQAPPPAHTVVAVTVIAALFLYSLPPWEAVDEVATAKTFTNRVFPNVISIPMLVFTRVVFTLVVFGVTVYSMFPGNGWVQTTGYLPASKLRRTSITMEGVRTLLPYTSWSWNLLGISFALNAYIAHQVGVLEQQDLPQPLLRAALIVYEIAAPSTLLVSFVTAHAIWPNLIKQGVSTVNIKATRTLIWHNANIVMALTEMVLLGGIPVQLSHFAVAPLFGILYILQTWLLIYQLKPSAGPQFLYFFLDTTLGMKLTYAILALLVVMFSSFSMFAVAHWLLNYSNAGLVPRFLLVLLVCRGVCRFRD